MRVAVAASLALFFVVALARDARADFDFQLATGVNVRALRETPALTTKPITTSARTVEEGAVPMRGGMTFLGPYIDSSLTIDDRWMLPLIGFGAYGAIGSYDSVVTSRDGSIVRVRPWTTFAGEVLLPGLGYRAKERRWLFGGQLRTGVGWLTLDGSMASGADSNAIDLSRATFLLAAELEVCRRLDPVTRVCLAVAPRIYDHGLLNGATAGLRVEWGR